MRAKTQARSSAGKRGKPTALPKLIGYDGEVGNYISGLNRRGGTGREASRVLIREVSGVTGFANRHFPHCPCEQCERHREKRRRKQQKYGQFTNTGWGSIVNKYSLPEAGLGGQSRDDPHDHHRRYLTENGGCVYIDLNHVEVCLPETRSVYDHVACWHAGLRLLRRALDAANRKMPEGQKIHVLVNNSDGSGNSYGSHANFLVTRRCWRNIFERKIQYLLYLAAYQVSSVVLTGQGKVGSENRAPDVDYQLSQRADFFERIVGLQTTQARPIVNSRDEALCGEDDLRHRTARRDDDPARLHVIFYDSTLCHVATLLKIGVMQIVLAMIEAERVNRRLILDDPLDAVKTWSHDPGLRSQARLFSGGKVTAVELQYRFLEEAARFVNRGGCDGFVPHAQEILDTWAETLGLLEAGDLPALSRRLDWVLKLLVLQGVIADRRDLHWQHPAVKRLDHAYSDLDLEEGLFWAYERDGQVERVVDERHVEYFMSNPPEDTRAWARAQLTRLIGAERIEAMDWDHIRFIEGDDDWSLRHRTVDLSDPLGPGRDAIGDVDAIVESTRRNAE